MRQSTYNPAGLHGAQGSERFRYETMARIEQEKIKLTLSPHGDGMILERAMIESDGSVFTQALPIFSEMDIVSFIEFDIYREKLADRYAAISGQVRDFFISCD